MLLCRSESTVQITDMKKGIKGFYTLEAAILMPFLILAILSLGYFIKIEGLWENCIHGALDESARTAMKASNGVETTMTAERVKARIYEDNPGLDRLEMKNVRIGYSDTAADKLVSYRLEATERLELPLSFDREFRLLFSVKFRGFVGKKTRGEPMGASELETSRAKQTVWIFPQSGEKYHGENCTYVKATVHPVILSDSVRRRYDACGICRSGKAASGSLVFCFGSDGTAYHIGTCRTIERRSVTIDRSEAAERGYRPCSKCGGS